MGPNLSPFLRFTMAQGFMQSTTWNSNYRVHCREDTDLHRQICQDPVGPPSSPYIVADT